MKRLVAYAERGLTLLRSSSVARFRTEIVLAACFVACGRTSPSANAPDTSASTSPIHATADAGEAGPSPEQSALWARASEGVEEDLMRLASTEGAAGLAEGATTPASRLLAARAMAHTRGLSALPWLAEMAGSDDLEVAREAARSAVALGARGRDQNDPEDADELRAGCTRLVAIAKDTKRERTIRIDAVRAVRLLVERGCAKAEDLPTDLDAKP